MATPTQRKVSSEVSLREQQTVARPSTLKRSGTVCMVTGCSSGIGLALCRELKKRNCIVYATARKESAIAALKAEGFEAVILDVVSEKSIKEAVAEVHKKEGRIDVLINNAGINIYGPLIEQDLNEVKNLFETNVFGVLAVSKHVAPIMITQKKGKIVNIGSVVGLLAIPFGGSYSASKSAVNALSDALRMELAPFGIEVSSVITGGVKSEIANNAIHTLEKHKDSKNYGGYYEYMKQRAAAGQVNGVPAEVFAQKLVRQILNAKLPARLYGGGLVSMFYWMSVLLPLFIIHWIFTRRFGLTKIRIPT